MEIKIIKIALYFAYITTIVTGKSYLVETSGDTVNTFYKDTKPAATGAEADAAKATRDETAATSATDATTATAAPPSNDYNLLNLLTSMIVGQSGLYMAGLDWWDLWVQNVYLKGYG